jgi:ribosomal protein S27E
MDKNKRYRYCGKCKSEMDESLVCAKCGRDHHVKCKKCNANLLVYSWSEVEPKCTECGHRNKLTFGAQGVSGILATVLIIFTILGLVMGFGLAGWLDAVFVPARAWMGERLGLDFALSAAYEDDNYFRTTGTRIDFNPGDIEAISARANEIQEYRIRITETMSDIEYGIFNPGLFIVEQNILFERSVNVIRVQVSPLRTQQGNRVAFYDRLFDTYQLLPFGTYYIVTENDETYILMNVGLGDGNYMKRRSVIRAAENPALYNRLLSYGISRIINFNAFQSSNVSAFEAAGLREFSIASPDDENWPDIFLREYQSMPGAYLMRSYLENGNVRHVTRAQFYYSRINTNVPSVNDWMQGE